MSSENLSIVTMCNDIESCQDTCAMCVCAAAVRVDFLSLFSSWLAVTQLDSAEGTYFLKLNRAREKQLDDIILVSRNPQPTTYMLSKI